MVEHFPAVRPNFDTATISLGEVDINTLFTAV
jgi:hypothetical protein